MCGIAGIAHLKGTAKVRERDLVAMRDTLVHRGPDDAGIHLSPDRRVGLATRRLKIIDLSEAAHMPMGASAQNSKFEIRNSKFNVCITHNGEVYNFKELRKELEAKGYRFRSKGDTEVILASYLEYGFDCVERLNGMFAFVISDERTGTLFAARDHLGVKPFYYALQNGTFYFGSEIKAILAHPDFKKELDLEGVSHYLTFSTSPAPHTLFRDVRKLPPAHYLIVKGGEITEREYWNPASPEADLRGRDERFYIEETRRLLRDSIRLQMVSDVPFGCFLSGGVDSSTNAALMSEALGRPVETFSVGSAGFEKYNEFKYSREVARHLGARTHEILVTERHLEEFLPLYAFHADDPNGDQVCLPLFWLAKLTRENGVIVIQIGEGSDELFAGYDTYLLAMRLYERAWRWLARFPELVTRGVFRASALLTNPRFDFAREYLRRLAEGQEPYWGNAIAFSDLQKECLMTPRFKAAVKNSSYSVIARHYDELKNLDRETDFLTRLTYLELKHRLPELLLMRADKMTMAHSVEGRVPFLDRRLVELAFQMPRALKVKGGEPKYILKRAVAGIIPPEIIGRKKQGFATPMSEWLQPGSSTARRLISIIEHSKLKTRGLLDYDYVARIIHAHQRSGVEHNFRIWNLVTLSLWYDYWFG